MTRPGVRIPYSPLLRSPPDSFARANYATNVKFPRLRRRSTPAESAPDFEPGIEIRKGRPYDPAWDLWRPKRRWPGVLLTAVIVSGFVIVLGYRYATAPKEQTAAFTPSPSTPLQAPYFPPVNPKSAALQQLTGNKNRTSIPVRATGKLMVWYFQCRCFANFGVIVHDSSGQVVDIAYNSTGVVTAAVPARYGAGNYTIDVIADGSWTVSFIDPHGLAPLPLPYSYLSTGKSVLGPFSGPSATVGVDFVGAIGARLSLLVSDGTTAQPALAVLDQTMFVKKFPLKNLPSRYWLIVDGAGYWDVKVSQ